jgi:hypothetical protein
MSPSIFSAIPNFMHPALQHLKGLPQLPRPVSCVHTGQSPWALELDLWEVILKLVLDKSDGLSIRKKKKMIIVAAYKPQRKTFKMSIL